MNSLYIYGGAFNPPHIGHISVVSSVLSFHAEMGYRSANSRDIVFVIPCYEHGFDKKLVDFEHRMEMCRLAFSIFRNQVQVVNLEERYTVKYTVNLLKALKEDFSGKNLKLVIGSDNDISKWKDPEGIKALAEIVVIPRGWGYTPQISSSEFREMLKAKDQLYRQWIPKKVCEYIERHGLYGT
jgi:nicotinate-nucleotide adenylyltransferase